MNLSLFCKVKCLAGGVALAIVFSASAAVAVPTYLDLGAAVIDPVLPGGAAWNQLSESQVGAAGSAIADLQDANGNLTGIGVAVTAAADPTDSTLNFSSFINNGGGDWGGAPIDWAVEGITGDSFFVNDGGDSLGILTFSGLTAGQPYRFSVISSREGSAPRAGNFLLGGVGGVGGVGPGNHVGSFDARIDGFDAENLMIWNVTPTGTTLELSVTVDVVSDPASTFAYLNGVSIELIPEPSSIALMGLCAVSFVMRGRRRS